MGKKKKKQLSMSVAISGPAKVKKPPKKAADAAQFLRKRDIRGNRYVYVGRNPKTHDMTGHCRSVFRFMQNAEQEIPVAPTVPSLEVRQLRARLVMEEAFELVKAMGLRVDVLANSGPGPEPEQGDESFLGLELRHHDQLVFRESCELDGEYDIFEVVDACGDLRVVTTGTLLAFGCRNDRAYQRIIDDSNLRKFDGGTRREDGKWLKPANWVPPTISLKKQLDREGRSG
jgi:predicted HAD superfamily Cof-like phosphohydrolase